MPLSVSALPLLTTTGTKYGLCSSPSMARLIALSSSSADIFKTDVVGGTGIAEAYVTLMNILRDPGTEMRDGVDGGGGARGEDGMCGIEGV